MIGNDPMLWRIVWKEYRVQRSFWLAIAGSGVGLMLVWMMLLDDPTVRFAVPWVIAALFPILYGVGSASMLFASEREEGTTELLRIFAAPPGRVFVAKLAFSVVSIMAIFGLLLMAAWIVCGGRHEGLPLNASMRFTACFALELLAWGFFFSTVCRKVVVAVVLTAFVPVFVKVGTTEFLQRKFGITETSFWPSESEASLVFIIPLLAAAYVLTRRTMAGRAIEWSLPRRTRRPAPAAGSALARLADVRDTAPAWRRQLGRLVWLEFRQARVVGIVFFAVGILLTALAVLLGPSRPDPGMLLLGILVLPTLAGAGTFQTDGGRKTRLLAEHGLSPPVVWLTRQIVWLVLTLLITAPCLVVFVIANQLEILPGVSAAVFVMAFIPLGYAAGQFVSILIARGVTAAFVGLVLFSPLAAWTWLMILLRVPFWISVIPMVVLLMLATLGWSRHWLLESATWRSWTRLAMCVSLALAVIWGGIGAYRVFEIPTPDAIWQPGWAADAAAARHDLVRPITQEEVETANLYRQAMAEFRTGVSLVPEKDGSLVDAPLRILPAVDGPDGMEGTRAAAGSTALSGWENASALERKQLAENQEPLSKTLAATERTACVFIDPSRPQPESPWNEPEIRGCSHLANLILLSARALEGEGKLDEALERYVAVMRLARHAASRGSLAQWSAGAQIERLVAVWMPLWAAHPDQSAERIEAGARRIRQELDRFPRLSDALRIDQFARRQLVLGDVLEIVPKVDRASAGWGGAALRALDRIFPWERTRSLRLLDLVAASQLQSAAVVEEALAIPGRDVSQWGELVGVLPWSEDDNRRALAGWLGKAGGTVSGLWVNRQATSDTRRSDSIPWKWVTTTFPVNILVEGDDTSIWIVRLNRELWARVLVLSLELQAWKKGHGEYPAQLDVLGGEWPNAMIDPYTGTEFGYRPSGFPTGVRMTSGLTHFEEVVSPGRPVFWTAGLNHARVVPTGRTEKGEPTFQVVEWIGPVKDPRTGQAGKPSAVAFPLP